MPGERLRPRKMAWPMASTFRDRALACVPPLYTGDLKIDESRPENRGFPDDSPASRRTLDLRASRVDDTFSSRAAKFPENLASVEATANNDFRTPGPSHTGRTIATFSTGAFM